ncbi:6495_t:CDS:2, partial [Racocetra persica]
IVSSLELLLEPLLDIWIIKIWQLRPEYCKNYNPYSANIQQALPTNLDHQLKQLLQTMVNMLAKSKDLQEVLGEIDQTLLDLENGSPVGVGIEKDKHLISGYFQELAKPSDANNAIKNNTDVRYIDFNELNRDDKMIVENSPDMFSRMNKVTFRTS